MEENNISDQVNSILKIPGKGRIKYILEKRNVYISLDFVRLKKKGGEIVGVRLKIS